MRKTRSQTQAATGTSALSALQGASNARNAPKRTSPIPTASVRPMPQSSASQVHPIKEYKELQEMLYAFRVTDLQAILTFIGATNAGRKIELQRKIFDLLKTHYNTLEPKIRQIYKSSYANSVNSKDDNDPDYGPPLSVKRTSSFSNNVTPAYPIHPDVRLKKLAFYDVKATLLQPSSLVPQNLQRVQEAAFYFILTPQQVNEITSNRDVRNLSKIEHTVQVQLRFCLLETSCEQEDCFPPNVLVKVNNKACTLPNPIPTNRPNVEPKRPPRPVNVTTNVKLSPTVTNHISVQWCSDYSRGYVIAAYLVRKLTSTELLQKMKTRGVKAADYTRALIKEKLTEDADCEIATTMLKVSLICPLGKMRMTIPCRSSTCSHLQCFDASLYLQMNERKPTWNCPVCDKPAIYESLVIDGYFQAVLASQNLSSDDTEIQLHKDGSWSNHIEKAVLHIIDTPQKSIMQKVEVISDDLEVIITSGPEPDTKPIVKAASANVAISSINQQTPSNTNETVDLTVSDSDDDFPVKRRRTKSPNAPATKSSAPAPTTNTKTVNKFHSTTKKSET